MLKDHWLNRKLQRILLLFCMLKDHWPTLWTYCVTHYPSLPQTQVNAYFWLSGLKEESFLLYEQCTDFCPFLFFLKAKKKKKTSTTLFLKHKVQQLQIDSTHHKFLNSFSTCIKTSVSTEVCLHVPKTER